MTARASSGWQPVVLEVTEVGLRFGGLAALDMVSLRVQPREIVGVIGPNRAGKSTLLNAVSGGHSPTSGRIAFEGHDITRAPDHTVASLGIARTFQSSTLFAGLTARDNVLLGLHLAYRVGR